MASTDSTSSFKPNSLNHTYDKDQSSRTYEVKSSKIEHFLKLTESKDPYGNDNNIKYHRINRRTVKQRPNVDRTESEIHPARHSKFFKEMNSREINDIDTADYRSSELKIELEDPFRVKNKIKIFENNPGHPKYRKLKEFTISAIEDNRQSENLAESKHVPNDMLDSNVKITNKTKYSHQLKKSEKTKFDYFLMKPKPVVVDFSQEFLQSLTNRSLILGSNDICNSNSPVVLETNNEDAKTNNITFTRSNFKEFHQSKILETHQPKNRLKENVVINQKNRSKSLHIPRKPIKYRNNCRKAYSLSDIVKSKNCNLKMISLSNVKYGNKIWEDNQKIFSPVNKFTKNNSDDMRQHITDKCDLHRNNSIIADNIYEQFPDNLLGTNSFIADIIASPILDNLVTMNLPVVDGMNKNHYFQRCSDSRKNWQETKSEIRNTSDQYILRSQSGDCGSLSTVAISSDLVENEKQIFELKSRKSSLKNTGIHSCGNYISTKAPVDTLDSNKFQLPVDHVMILVEHNSPLPTEHEAFSNTNPPEQLYSLLHFDEQILYCLHKSKHSKRFTEIRQISSLLFEREYSKEIEKHRNPLPGNSAAIKPERKRIYTTVLKNISRLFIDESLDNILNVNQKKLTEKSKNKTKVKPEAKIQLLNLKLLRSFEIQIEDATLSELLIDTVDNILRSIKDNSKPPIQPILSTNWMDDISTLPLCKDGSDTVGGYIYSNDDCSKKSFNINESEDGDKSSRKFLPNNGKEMHKRFNRKDNVNVNLLKIDKYNPEIMKYETDMLNSFKQTILKYEMKFRKMSEEKETCAKENSEIMEYNISLQKRHGALLNDFKLEKREIAFIKNQITVMIARLQSIPDKLIQLESENENLKSEISDLERTLIQRDQLFTSERQINASLSEEIIKLEAETVNRDLMKNVCEEFENLNEEYEMLKVTLEETEDKLFEVVHDRDNLIKHAKVMEEHLYKLKNENHYYQLMTSSGVLPNNTNTNRYLDNSGEYSQRNHMAPIIEKYDCNVSNKNPESTSKGFHGRSNCRHSRNRNYSHHSNHSCSSSSTSSLCSQSSNDSERKYRRRKRKSSHKHKHRSSHSHKHSHRRKDKGSKAKDDIEIKTELSNKNQNTNAVSEPVIEMPKSREELKSLEKLYDVLQFKKNKLEVELSHLPVKKGGSINTSMTSVQDQELLEDDLDKCDKKLATLRKILKQCKVFKMLP